MNKQQLYALDPILNPIETDMLHRESEFVDRFYDLITQSVRPPFAISIDGLWGTGKTTVMKMLESRLHEGGYSTFWFNPWEYRRTESVVLAFLQRLAAKHITEVEQLEKSGGKIFKVLLKAGIGTALKIYTKGNVSLKSVEADLQNIEEGQKLSYERYQDSIESIKDEFKELIEKIGAKYTQKPVCIFFDDLDRCLPDDAIQLLEALKNLLVVQGCNAIVICGIDTRVAKQFISKHYNGLEETFAINYFRKIFNLTISMPYSPDIYNLLVGYIKELYDWDGSAHRGRAEKLANMVYTRGEQAEMTSVRKYLNVIHTFYAFQKFNPGCQFEPENDFVVHLLLVKEAWQPLYENITREAVKNNMTNMKTLFPVKFIVVLY